MQLWEILVPTIEDGKPIKLKKHKEWDKVIRGMAGGLTIIPPLKGQWFDDETQDVVEERVIPVRIACTRDIIIQICALTKGFYAQKSVMAYRISEDVILV